MVGSEWPQRPPSHSSDEGPKGSARKMGSDASLLHLVVGVDGR